jgi:hypothetical protein
MVIKYAFDLCKLFFFACMKEYMMDSNRSHEFI